MDTLTTFLSDTLCRSEFYQQGLALPDRTVGMAERVPMAGGDDWMVGGMAVLFFVMAIVVYRSHAVLRYRLRSFFTGKRLYSEENVSETSNEALNIFCLTSISSQSLSVIFFDDIYRLCDPEGVNGPAYWVFAVGYAVLMLVVHLKAILYVLVNWVFFDRESGKKWLAGYFLMTSLTAFLFYPLALLDIFANYMRDLVIQGVILVVLLYEIMLFYKLFVNFKTKKYGYLVLFLYFCSVELMPALILWTWADWHNHHFIIINLLY